MTGSELESGDIQGLLLTGYREMKHSRFLFLRFGPQGKGREWLARLAESATSAEPWVQGKDRPKWALNVALSRPGLEALGWNSELLNTFSPEFHDGMAAPEKSRILGDSAPEGWEFGGGPEKELHALVMLYAEDKETFGEFTARQSEWLQAAGLELMQAVDGSHTPDHKEHFGFRDGISQPLIEGARPGQSPSLNMVKAGEFILGYKNQNGQLTPTPCLPAGRDPQGLLPAHPQFAGWKDLGRNGSYLVLRKMSQDVHGFWDYFAKQAQGEPHPDEAMVRLAAKSMGRWPSGTPLVLSPDKDDPKLGMGPHSNDFLYQGDGDGLKCPIGAHVRRANPRDSLRTGYWPEPTDAKDSLKTSGRHRILRRGRPYGEYLEKPLAQAAPGGDRGLLFLCFNADIRGQFEFIQQTWINNPKFAGLKHDKDPIVGDNDGGSGSQMTIPELPARRELKGLSRFTQVRGGAYLFFPGLKALKFLAGGI